MEIPFYIISTVIGVWVGYWIRFLTESRKSSKEVEVVITAEGDPRELLHIATDLKDRLRKNSEYHRFLESQGLDLTKRN